MLFLNDLFQCKLMPKQNNPKAVIYVLIDKYQQITLTDQLKFRMLTKISS